jgi:glycerol-3-phosphate acyltransferase PlsY
MQQNEQPNQEKVPLRRKAALLWRFLKGSKGFFVVSMLTTALAALMDMLTPQIVRMAVDNVVGTTDTTYAAWIMTLVNRLGGFAYLRDHLWILAVAVALPVLAFVFAQPVPECILAVVTGVLVLFQHRSNIGRLLRGEEARFSPKSQK